MKKTVATGLMTGLVALGAAAVTGSATAKTHTGLSPHQSWQAGYATAKPDYRGMYVPLDIQRNLAGASMTQWCTGELGRYSQPVDSSEFINGCLAATAGEPPQ
jgi:hypothetical protein